MEETIMNTLELLKKNLSQYPVEAMLYDPFPANKSVLIMNRTVELLEKGKIRQSEVTDNLQKDLSVYRKYVLTPAEVRCMTLILCGNKKDLDAVLALYQLSKSNILKRVSEVVIERLWDNYKENYASIQVWLLLGICMHTNTRIRQMKKCKPQFVFPKEKPVVRVVLKHK
jgi:DNA-binding ferritin-like protein (Dps family)